MMSAPPVAMHVDESANARCNAIEAKPLFWGVRGGRWFTGHLTGAVTPLENLVNGCPVAAEQFSFFFRIDLQGGDDDAIASTLRRAREGAIELDGAEIDVLLSRMARAGMASRACFVRDG